jgi:hypothetical protein
MYVGEAEDPGEQPIRRVAAAPRELPGVPQHGRRGVEVAGGVLERLFRDLQDGPHVLSGGDEHRRREEPPRVDDLQGCLGAAEALRLHH